MNAKLVGMYSREELAKRLRVSKGRVAQLAVLAGIKPLAQKTQRSITREYEQVWYTGSEARALADLAIKLRGEKLGKMLAGQKRSKKR